MPNSVEAEKAVLSCCLQDNECIDLVVATAGRTGEAFYNPGRQIIWTAITDERAAGRTVDVVSLHATLNTRRELEKAGGVSELAEILGFAPGPRHLKHYLDILRDYTLMRRVIRGSNETLIEAYQNPEDVAAWVAKVEARNMGIAGDVAVDDSIAGAVTDLANQLADAEGGRDRSIPFGVPQLDMMLGGGVRPKQLAIVAARPSLGKTSLGWQQLVVSATHRQNPKPVGFFSLEMPRADIIGREVCRRCEIEFADLASAFRTLPQGRRAAVSAEVTKTFLGIRKWPVRIDDRGGLHVDQIRSVARLWKSRHKIELILIDYLQLCRGTGENRQTEVSYISSQCKAMAKELDVPVVLLAQLNRDGDDDPRMKHLRESGSVEQDADVVVLIGKDRNTDDKDGKSARFLRLEKNRNGATHDGILVWFDNRRMTFEQRVP